MASNCARNLVQRSSNSARTLLFRGQSSHSIAPAPSKLGGVAPTIPRLSPRHRPIFSSRLPVELGCGKSLLPLHSATASALLNSMLSPEVGQWGFLSEAYKPRELVIPTYKRMEALRHHYNRTFKSDAGDVDHG